MYSQKLLQYFKEFEVLEAKFQKEAEIFFSFGGLQPMDLFSSAIINRAIWLLKGFTCLAKENNYICAIPLIRMQLDNSLRFYASTLVPDHNKFVQDFFDGMKVSNMKVINKKQMKDSYLLEMLEELFPGVSKNYEDTSGFIHLSNSHALMQMSIEIEDNKKSFHVEIGNFDFFSIEQKEDYAMKMKEVSKILLSLVGCWKLHKAK